MLSERTKVRVLLLFLFQKRRVPAVDLQAVAAVVAEVLRREEERNQLAGGIRGVELTGAVVDDAGVATNEMERF